MAVLPSNFFPYCIIENSIFLCAFSMLYIYLFLRAREQLMALKISKNNKRRGLGLQSFVVSITWVLGNFMYGKMFAKSIRKENIKKIIWKSLWNQILGVVMHSSHLKIISPLPTASFYIYLQIYLVHRGTQLLFVEWMGKHPGIVV